MSVPPQEPPTTQFEAVPRQVMPPGPPVAPVKARRRRWPWWVLGVFVAFLVIGTIGAALSPPKPASPVAQSAPTTQAVPDSPAPAAAPEPVAPPVAAPPPAADTQSALQSAKAGCTAFESGVDPVMTRVVQSSDLAPAIRVTHGIAPDDPSGNASVNAPWNVADGALIDAASADPSFQSIVDALNSLRETIVKADPGGDLSPIGTASQAVTGQCQKYHAL